MNSFLNTPLLNFAPLFNYHCIFTKNKFLYLTARCPVFKELQELLGGTEASNITAERVASQIGAAGTGSHGILDPSLNVAVAVGSHYSPGITVPRAQVLG